ncbi:MAG: translation initiation factor IF-2 subunit alpha [Acidilobus sp.]
MLGRVVIALPLLNRRSLPDVGEVLVGTIKEIYDYGAYLELEEFNGLRAFLPWSEISNRSFRSINEIVKMNERVAVKVIRVNKAKGQVDVSLKRVTDDERRRKMTWWKRTQKAVNIVLVIAKELKKTERQAYADVIWRLEDKYGDVMAGLEMAALEGEQPLAAAGLPQEWLKPLAEAAKKYVEVKKVKLSAIVTARTAKSNGVDKIKDLLKFIEGQAFSDVVIKVYSIGAPKYRVDLVGSDYKTLEESLARLQESAAKKAKELGLEFSLQRLEE